MADKMNEEGVRPIHLTIASRSLKGGNSSLTREPGNFEREEWVFERKKQKCWMGKI